MNWRTKYKDDFGRNKKGQVKEQILNKCGISKGCFNSYLNGKEGLPPVMEKIKEIVNNA